MRRLARGLAALVCGVVASLSVAIAVDPDEILDDPVLETRARDIGRELRCITCQSQSIEDSAAPLAKDLRILVREHLVAGESDEEIVAYVTARYGDYVRLKPRVSGGTMILWLTPLLTLGVGGSLVFWYFRRMRDPDDKAIEPDIEADTDDI